MAQSPAHKFGQIIGDLLEAAVEPFLRRFAESHGLYLDRKGRRAARARRKVSWADLAGNTHDLDYVLERGGTANCIGVPVAFIETAWRRYTKHSRNKAQEIQGAVLPLAEAYRNAAPFIGVIVAGVFTDGALAQLRSLGFSVLHFPYETVVEAFKTIGVDAYFTEQTPDAEFARKVRRWDRTPKGKRAAAAQKLLQVNAEAVRGFLSALERAAARAIELVRVLPLHGRQAEWDSVEKAIRFIERYEEGQQPQPMPVARYEVEIRYNNGDRVDGQFAGKEAAISFLRGYAPTASAGPS